MGWKLGAKRLWQLGPKVLWQLGPKGLGPREIPTSCPLAYSALNQTNKFWQVICDDAIIMQPKYISK